MIGTTGSGKTTFARALAQRLGVPHVELDALFWQPGWVMSSADELRAKVETVLDDRGWVVDGNYSARLGSLVLEQADQIVWLDLPLRTTFSRVLRRTLRRLRTGEVIWGTNKETLGNVFLSRDSLLLYSLRAHRRFRRSRGDLVTPYPHVRLRSRREVAQYLDDLA